MMCGLQKNIRGINMNTDNFFKVALPPQKDGIGSGPDFSYASQSFIENVVRSDMRHGDTLSIAERIEVARQLQRLQSMDNANRR